MKFQFNNLLIVVRNFIKNTQKSTISSWKLQIMWNKVWSPLCNCIAKNFISDQKVPGTTATPVLHCSPSVLNSETKSIESLIVSCFTNTLVQSTQDIGTIINHPRSKNILTLQTWKDHARLSLKTMFPPNSAIWSNYKLEIGEWHMIQTEALISHAKCAGPCKNTIIMQSILEKNQCCVHWMIPFGNVKLVEVQLCYQPALHCNLVLTQHRPLNWTK